MNRSVVLLLLGLGIGVAVMYGGANFRLRLEPVSPPTAAAPPAEPYRLPESITGVNLGAQRFDPNVRPVQMTGDPAGASDIELVKDQVAGESVKWLISQSPRVKVAADTVTVRLKEKPAAGKTADIFIDGTLIKANDQAKNGITYTAGAQEFDISLAKAKIGATSFKLGVKIGDPDAATAESSSITIFRPLVPPDPNADLVTVSSFQNSSHSADAGLFESYPPAGAVVNVFGGYLRLRGRADVPRPTLVFFKLVDGTLFPVKATDLRIAGAVTAEWDSELELFQDPPGTQLSLIVRADSATGHTFSKKPVTYDPKAGVRPDKPTFVANDPVAPAVLATPTGTEPAVYQTNALALTALKVNVPANTQKVLLYIGEGNRPVQVLAPTTPPSVLNFGAVTLPGDGTHAISVSCATGRDESPKATILVRVRTKGPTVAGLSSTGFGSGGGKETLTVQFAGEELNKSTLINTSFTLTFNDGTGTPKPISTLDAALPAYVAATKQVILTYDSKVIVPGEYTLTVTNAVQDIFGNALVGPQGLTTNDSVVFKVLAFAGDKALPSQTAGVFQTGPAIPLSEYLKPRPPVEGFNPGDRVEARVVRLYYYRDAHRVAQLVNRTVKSYNVAAVDIRRRAADRGRDDADKATDERKRLESVAVRAAQEARAAETELNNLQNGTNVARTQAAGSRIELLQLEQDLAQARRELERAQLAVPGQVSTDVNVAAQVQSVSRLTAQLADLDAQIKAAPPNVRDLQIQRAGAETNLNLAKDALAQARANAQILAGTGTDAAQKKVQDLDKEIKKRQSVVQTAEAVEQNNTARIAAAQQNVAVKREAEGRTLEAWQVKELEERRLRENQFRVEVGAAKADPDTYGPADPESVDPVLQTSISVIGEGLIQIRGPIKGLNAIRTMINQIDSPVGQMRISVHTLQVNGERGDRMEKVVANIQRHLDHSRFLTAQSAQMLRYAVSSVAARKATEVEALLPPGSTQWHRDQKYLYAFFGKDFVDELIELDSEFLKTGNKLLSLNSMDSTSLSAGLFLLALAKNDVRAEILQEFMGLVQGKLPDAEWTYYSEGVSDPKCCDACKDKKMYLLAYNSKFQSFLGFFNAEVAGANTLNPLQREFLRLAQIFKSRMITEMQLKQRVMERSLLEERVGAHYLQDLKDAFELEKMAKEGQTKFQDALQEAIGKVTVHLTKILATLDQVDALIAEIDTDLDWVISGSTDRRMIRGVVQEVAKFNNNKININDKDKRYIKDSILDLRRIIDQFWYASDENYEPYKRINKLIADVLANGVVTKEDLINIVKDARVLRQLIKGEAEVARTRVRAIFDLLQAKDPQPVKAVVAYESFRKDILARLRRGFDLDKQAQEVFRQASQDINTLPAAAVNFENAARKAQNARRPLDEKKLLDMLVDEMEDKFVEILEGTRAHTSNIDNYMKSVTTALDDDFNTQYYLPSFRRARDASRFWDVTLAQIETTTILTNNRSFGKVSPAATMEFDLPKRKILLTEGFQAAKALVDEYGALVNDPSFLALAKMASGNPVSMMSGGGGGVSAVRNVLPGLPGSPDETIMAQAGPGRKEFGSALEALIPDPAIYKFETGTGFEIRPVLSPDGQSVVFDFDYMYTTDVREPVRADEKHLGRVKRHFIHTDVQLGNFELREVSKYMVALKAARTARGVQLLQDIPVAGALFRPLPSAASSLQQNLIYSQATIFPTLFDLMGLRYAPAVADLDPLAERLAEFAVRNRRLDLEQRIYDGTAARVDESLRIPFGERRMDLYRPQVSVPAQHPNGFMGPGLRLRDGHWVEGHSPRMAYPETQNAPSISPEGRPKPYPPGTPYPAPLDTIPNSLYPQGYPLPQGGVSGQMDLQQPSTRVTPAKPEGGASGLRPAPQAGSPVLPPGYPVAQPVGAVPVRPTNQPGAGLRGQPAAGYAPTRSTPLPQLPTLPQPGNTPPGYPAPAPSNLLPLSSMPLPNPGAVPGYGTPPGR